MDFKLDLHTHTIMSGHAYGTLSEMIAAGQAAQLEILGVTEHGKGIPGTCQEIYFRNSKVIPRQYDNLEFMFGCEMNIIDYEGRLSEKEEVIKKYFDIRLAGIHELCYKIGNQDENTSAYIGAIQNPLVDIITHPDDGRIPIDCEAIVKAAKEYHTLLELNNSSLDEFNSRANAWENQIRLLKLCKEMQVPVIANTDAHAPQMVGRFDAVKKVFMEVDFPEALIMNCNVEKFREFIKENREQEKNRS